uniref:Uncharacterized protein n=2 Tax=Lotharella globosa TaxID=91324 RepID=A0A7S4DUX7_9EUKA
MAKSGGEVYERINNAATAADHGGAAAGGGVSRGGMDEKMRVLHRKASSGSWVGPMLRGVPSSSSIGSSSSSTRMTATRTNSVRFKESNPSSPKAQPARPWLSRTEDDVEYVPNVSIYTVTVGRRASHAHYYLPNINDPAMLLSKLAKSVRVLP